MKRIDHFYCVCCNRLIQAEHSSQLFTTGFYRIDYPLGTCKPCAEDEQRLRAEHRIGAEWKRYDNGGDSRMDAYHA